MTRRQRAGNRTAANWRRKSPAALLLVILLIVAQAQSALAAIVNTVTVSGTFGGAPITAVASESVDVANAAPGMTVVKAGVLNDFDGNLRTTAGDTISYTLTITNTGNISFTGIAVADPLVSLALSGGDLAPLAVLDVGETWTYAGTYTLLQADLTSNGGGDGDIDNIATVTSDQLPAQTASAAVPLNESTISAVNDGVAGINGASGGVDILDVLPNDLLNGIAPVAGAGGTVALSVTTPATPVGGGPVPALNTATGLISVPAGTPQGIYAIAYQICESLNVTNCASATATVGVDAATNPVADAFKAQTHNFLVRRSDLITSHEPSIYRLANRDKGHFQPGSSGFNVVGENGNLKGDFAMNAKGVAHALEVASSGGAAISPAADLVDSSSAFNAWLEGQFAIYRDDDAGQSQTGDFFVGYAGADWRVNDRALLGVMGQLDWTEDRQDNSISVVSGTGWMIGPYLSAEPVDNIFVDLRALWGRSDNSAIQDVLGSRYEGGFDTERWLAQAVIAGKYDAGDFDIAPEMSLIYMHENQDSYSVTDGVSTVLVAGQNVDLGRLAGGVTISYQGEIGDAALEPFVGGRLLWDFENPGLMNAGGALASRDELRPQFKAGLNIRNNASQFSLEATYDGLGSEGLKALTGKIMFSHSF